MQHEKFFFVKMKLLKYKTCGTVQCMMDEWTKYDERLIDAAYKSDRERIKETIRKKGASPVKVSRDGQTALHISVKKGMLDCVEFMLAENPDLSTIDLQGRTVYHIAASKGDPVMLKKLLDYSRWCLEVKDTKEMTALHYAVASGENECVKLLINNNSPVDLRDGEGRTPLLTAIMNGYEKIAMALVLHGVDVNAPDYKERTPIFMACIQGMRDVVALLISKGADSKLVDAEGKTLEQIAGEAGHVEIVDILRNSADSGIMDIEHMHENDENEEEEEVHENGDVDETDHNIQEEQSTEMNDKENKRHSSTSSSSAQNYILEVKPTLRSPTDRVRTDSANRRSILKNDDSSLTTSIIESLMGYDIGNETINESTIAETQEKYEQEKYEMQQAISERDKKIEELEQEISNIKKKLRWETDMRFQAEKEVLGLKSQLENIDIQHSVSSEKEETQTQVQEEEPEETEIGNEETVEMEQTEQSKEETSEETKEHEEEKEEETEEDESQKEVETKKEETVQDHINFLEDHILGLEDDIEKRDIQITNLQGKLENAQELVDLNNNTTVSLEVFNKYKAEKKTERTQYREQIKILESQLSEIQASLNEAKSEKEYLEDQMSSEADEKNNLINTMRDESHKLQTRMTEFEEQYTKDISCYRENILSLYQNKMDENLDNILKKIVLLRKQES
ncbi:ankycorbin-like isoform X3 [Clytia hemisphaerica]